MLGNLFFVTDVTEQYPMQEYTSVEEKKRILIHPKFCFTLDLNLIAVIWDVKLAINDKLQSIVFTLHWRFTL